eukprot:6929539-Pyramimonas_sp.AAC.1
MGRLTPGMIGARCKVKRARGAPFPGCPMKIKGAGMSMLIVFFARTCWRDMLIVCRAGGRS